MNNLLLRRRGELLPLDRSLQNEDTYTTAPFNVIVISPCQIWVSNDPAQQGDLDVTPCNITSYSCFEETNTTWDGNDTASGLTDIIIQFDYELHYDAGVATLENTVIILENSILQHLASATGLENCPVVSKSRQSARTLQEQYPDNETMSQLVGVGSRPKDQADSEFATCLVPVTTSDVSGSICQPMTGYFTATLNLNSNSTSATEVSIQSTLLRLVREGMNNDMYKLGNIREVSFIGQRTADGKPPFVISEAVAESGDGGLSNVGLAFICIAGVLLFLLAGLFVAKKRTKQSRQKELIVHHPESNGLDGGDKLSNAGGSRISVDPLAARDALALKPQPVVKVRRDDDATASLSQSPGSKSSSTSSKSPSPKKSRGRKSGSSKAVRTPTAAELLEQDNLQRLDIIAEDPHEDDIFQESDAEDDDGPHSLRSIA